MKRTSLCPSPCAVCASGQMDPAKPLPPVSRTLSVIGRASAPAFQHPSALIVGGCVSLLFPRAKDKDCCLHFPATVVRKKDGSPPERRSCSPPGFVSFPSVTAAQSRLAAEHLGCQRENLLTVCRMERGLSRWQEPDYVTQEALCPVPGCVQTFPCWLRTRRCRLFPMPLRWG